MDFIDEIKQFVLGIKEIVDKLKTEEATKLSLINPFIELLGYQVRNPNEVIPEFVADVGTKKGEKVDYAICIDGKPAILIEAKPVNDPLEAHDSQLFRYFSTTGVKFAILTNGTLYKFYSDIQNVNKMDDTPFLEFDLFNFTESQVAEVKKFKKGSFNQGTLSESAATLKYTNVIKNEFEKLINEPSVEFAKLIIRKIYTGVISQSILERYKPIVKKALSEYLDERLNDMLNAAIKATKAQAIPEPHAEDQTEEVKPEGYIITETEIEAFYMIKSICFGLTEPKRITYIDYKKKFSIVLDNNLLKWFCHLNLEGNKKYLGVRASDGKETRIPINNLDDIYNFQEDIKKSIMFLTKPKNNNPPE
jgi:predicted type IV restriction endonuclease